MPLSLPAQNRECSIFGSGMVKNIILTQHEDKDVDLRAHVAALTLGSGGYLHVLWTTLYPSNYVIYYIYLLLLLKGTRSLYIKITKIKALAIIKITKIKRGIGK